MSLFKENVGIILAVALVIYPLAYITAFPGIAPPDWVLTWANMALQFIFGTAVSILTLRNYGITPFKSKTETLKSKEVPEIEERV